LKNELLTRILLCALLVVMTGAVPSGVTAADPSVIKADEDVILFPAAASVTEGGDGWTVPIHGWIFEREEDSVWRKGLVDGLLSWLELGDVSLEDEIFRSRASMFLVDNERGKKPVVRVGGRRIIMGASDANGHFGGEIFLSRTGPVLPSHGAEWISTAVCADTECGRIFPGTVQLVPPSGVSVISDIDDTIKISGVTDKKLLLQNTFLREYRAVPGMSEMYRRWSDKGAVFHYVSASPWQLYPAISGFLVEEGFPSGSFHMKNFRVKDRTFFDLFRSPEDAKFRVVQSIMKTFPDRSFILVGDSGEKDPEIYAAAARQFPDRIRFILIRDVEGDSSERARVSNVLKNIPSEKWAVFDDPETAEKVPW